MFFKKIKKFYLNKYITIMRTGGISTNISFLFKKTIEDIKIFKNTIYQYLIIFLKVFSKLKQFYIYKKINLTKYHKILHDYSKIKFAKPEEIIKLKGKIISALNLAFISYDYKYKLRTHKYLFWPDGVFFFLHCKQEKKPGRIYFINILQSLNQNKKKYKKIYVFRKSSKYFKHLA